MRCGAPLIFSLPGSPGAKFLVGGASGFAGAPFGIFLVPPRPSESRRMAKSSKTDPVRRKHTPDFDDNDAGPSHIRSESPGAQNALSELEDNGSENGAQGSSARSDIGSEEGNEKPDGSVDGLGDGMDLGGFSRLEEKVVKPLTPEALAAFKAAKEKTGVVYISRIPPGMRPTKVRHLMSQYGEIGKVYLQQEGKYMMTSFNTPRFA